MWSHREGREREGEREKMTFKFLSDSNSQCASAASTAISALSVRQSLFRNENLEISHRSLTVFFWPWQQTPNFVCFCLAFTSIAIFVQHEEPGSWRFLYREGGHRKWKDCNMVQLCYKRLGPLVRSWLMLVAVFTDIIDCTGCRTEVKSNAQQTELIYVGR